MSDEQAKAVNIIEEEESVRLNVSREIYQLARKGELRITRHACTGELTMTLGDMSASKEVGRDKDGGLANPLPYCLYDLVNMVKARK